MISKTGVWFGVGVNSKLPALKTGSPTSSMSNTTGHTMIFPGKRLETIIRKWLAGMGFDYDEMAKMGDQVRQTKLKS